MDNSPIIRGRGIPKKTIGEIIQKDLSINNLTVEMYKDLEFVGLS